MLKVLYRVIKHLNKKAKQTSYRKNEKHTKRAHGLKHEGLKIEKIGPVIKTNK